MKSLNGFFKKIVDPTKHASKKAFIDTTRSIFSKLPEASFVTVCIDIVNFRLFNEKFGVEKGDEFLIYFAEKIKKYTTKKNGVVSSCYASSDKFFMCYEKSKFDPDKLNFDLNNIIRAWSDDYEMNVKLGIWESNGSSDPGQNCDRAQLAVNTIKGVYGKNYVYYDSSMLERVARDDEMTKSMNKALTRGEFIPFFQPQYDANTKCIKSAELLVRWNSEKHGMIPPGAFLPLFEKNGCITEIDMYLWGVACGYLTKWRSKGYQIDHISVNMSRTDFYYPGVAEYLKSIVEKNKLKPADLHIEITESAYFENYQQFMSILNKIIEYGFPVEIDDFGSGYSSLTMLKNINFNVMKIDKSLIDGEDCEHTRLILTSIVGLAKQMGMELVSEGVETEKQYVFVKSVGCDLIQGFYFSKPLPVREFEDLLKTH